MKINYNDWFYDYHHYTKTNDKTFNDTKWITINQRYQYLIDNSSSLLDQQPFGVMGNHYGFQQLIDLMAKSNYTFSDVNDALIETYQNTLQNAMSKMVVNTQAVIFHTNIQDTRNVYFDRMSKYYIIDAPFHQLHFGDRDEFIRQKIHEMYGTENDHYVNINEFNQKNITKILGFTILCSVNGYICNDCQVAFSDKGFKFKVGWRYAADAEFIIYKLDESEVHEVDVNANVVSSGIIWNYDTLQLKDKTLINHKCLVNIYDKNFYKTTVSVPNFGVFTENGLEIRNIQQQTRDMISRLKSQTLTIVIYAFKYLHEIPNTFPAVNYMDIMDSRKVYTDHNLSVKTVNENQIISNSIHNTNKLEICTPPIVLDRSVNTSFDTLSNCLTLRNNMKSLSKTIIGIGNSINQSNTQDELYFNENVIKPAKQVYQQLMKYFIVYQKGAILTSLVSQESISLFETLLNRFRDLIDNNTIDTIQKYTFDELYGSNYHVFVNKITQMFYTEKLQNFVDISKVSKNYFSSDNSTRFNRPISEQCFITLRYHRDEQCWLFDYPTIKHFNGIGNTFYIDSDLDGTELFKFFVLYTDTFASAETNIEHPTLETVIDFDLFCNEVNHHIGYIKYWYAENELMKLSKMMYDKYDDNTIAQVLSKILKGKIEGSDILDTYASEINYEESNITSDQWDQYTEMSERSPFAINFLFYTMQLLYKNRDQMNIFFMRVLTDQKYDHRYVDINIASMLDHTRIATNYSQVSIMPIIFDLDASDVPNQTVLGVFYGLPIPFTNTANNREIFNHISTIYRFTYHIYDETTKFPLLIENDVNEEYYMSFSQQSGSVISYSDDIYMAKLICNYLRDMYHYISELQTNYQISYNSSSIIESAINTMQKIDDKIMSYYIGNEDRFHYSDISTIINDMMNDKFIERLSDIKSTLNDIKEYDIIYQTDRLLKVLKHIYVNFGFRDVILARARSLYLHLKRIHEKMNLYELNKWIDDIDIELINDLQIYVAQNENYNESDYPFDDITNKMQSIKTNIPPLLTQIDDGIKDLSIGLQSEYIDGSVQYVDFVIRNYVFDLFVLSDISFDTTKTYTKQPMYVVLQCTRTSHFDPPYGTTVGTGNISLLLQPITDMDNDGKYIIKSLSKIAEYAFFNDATISDAIMNVYDENGSLIDEINDVMISFDKIGTTADQLGKFQQLLNIRNVGNANDNIEGAHRSIDFENHHEEYVLDQDGRVISKKHADMNYELLLGNHFLQLHHDQEFVLQPTTWLQGSIDRLYISNQKINQFINKDYASHESLEMYFKPEQVLHIENADNGNTIDSIGGKYFVGQTLYAQTSDHKYYFPIIVTAMDHNMSKGFVEAKVDERNAKWFKASDMTESIRYLSNNIQCEIIDDNICNFIDEYSNSNYEYYPSIAYHDNEDDADAYSLPGDPVYVNNNANYVYSRLQWLFHDLVPNRLIDEEHKQYHFQFIGSIPYMYEDPSSTTWGESIRIKMLTQKRNSLTNSEMYPILRDEPNDHDIWKQEIIVFKNKITKCESSIDAIIDVMEEIMTKLAKETSESEKAKLRLQYEQQVLLRAKQEQTISRMNSYLEQLESPTTWYNVRSYEAAMVYIQNGRADQFSPTIISDIRDFLYTEQMEVYLYDWENKYWVNPEEYSIDIEHYDRNIVSGVINDNYDNYKTDQVMYSINIIPSNTMKRSGRLLVYLAYKKSDIYNSIPIHDKHCMVRFKPLLSLETKQESFDPYTKIRIRKHFDGNEKYLFKSYDVPDDFSIQNAFHIKRPKRNGKYTNTPMMRFCDITLQNGDNTYDYTNLDLYVRMPFKDVKTSQSFNVPTYNAEMNQNIDSFEPNQRVKLICVQNTILSSYNGNISNIIFEGITSYDEEKQMISIISSNIQNVTSGQFICTVFKDSAYKCCGGLITITISEDTNNLLDEQQQWIRIPQELSIYRELPMEFILVPKEDTDIDITNNVVIQINDHYEKTFHDDMNLYNLNLNNPFEYYYDSEHEIRLPISDTRRNNHSSRLVINTTQNPSVKLIKSPYIGICRYSLAEIPVNGVIDLTGYLPTPLSRDRYEFWVNGRYVSDPDDLIILSPTSIQLCNQKSLRNFEVIELVDDMNENIINRTDTIYLDLHGNIFGSYEVALLSNAMIREQTKRYRFNTLEHKQIHDYTKNIIPNPNNKDVEVDILDMISLDTSNITSYQQLYHIPSINGIPLMHITSDQLGLLPAPIEKVIESFDQVWKKEILTNPLFLMTHKDLTLEKEHQTLYLKIREYDNDSSMLIVYASGTLSNYFTLYISELSNGTIDDVNHTLKIIPFIRTGVYVLIEKEYKGMWLHSTFENCKPIKIQ